MGCFGVGVDPHHRKTSPCVSSEAAPVGYFRSLLVPNIYEEVYGEPYPGVELDVMPLDLDDLALLKDVSHQWASGQMPTEDDEVAGQRTDELYKLTRTLLAASFRGLQSRNRSGQLDELEGVLKNFAFIDENDALEFAKTHLKDDSNKVAEALPAYEVDVEDELDQPTAKVIPINPIVT
jgi:DNA sulfur modification protein DndC